MDNNIPGKITLQAGSETYTLQYTFNAMCRLEELTELSPDEFGSGRAKKLSTMRAMIWAGLLESMPGVKLEDAGRIIDEVGMLDAMAAATKAINAAKALARKGGNGAAHPPTAIRDGIGANS